jgi:hypothetical protein
MRKSLCIVTALVVATPLQRLITDEQSAPSAERQAAQSTGLCAATGRFLETAGIGDALQQAVMRFPAADADAELIIVTLANFGLCQYTFYSPSQNSTFTYADAEGGMHELGRGTPKTPAKPLPPLFLDLPAALAAALQKEMSLPLKSAVLRAAQPTGKSPVAVWVLTPSTAADGHVPTYYVAASDSGHALQVDDIRDVASDYDAQQSHIVDPFHGKQSAKLDCLLMRFNPAVQHSKVLSHQSCQLEQ